MTVRCEWFETGVYARTHQQRIYTRLVMQSASHARVDLRDLSVFP